MSERRERTTQGYLRFRCRACGKQFNERSGGVLNRARYPSDVIALLTFWRLRYKLRLRGLPEMFLIRGMEFSYEAVRDWEAKLTPTLIDTLRWRRKGRIGESWYVAFGMHDVSGIRVHTGPRCVPASLVDPFRRPILTPMKGQNLQRNQYHDGAGWGQY